MSNNKRCVTTVIPFRVITTQGVNKLQFYIHTRYKPVVSPAYSDLYEFPVGGLDQGEDAIDAGLRELQEETNMTANYIFPPQFLQTQIVSRSDIVAGYQPFYTLEMLKTVDGMLWFGPVFLVKVSSDADPQPNVQEAKDPKWLSAEEIIRLAKDQGFESQTEFVQVQKTTFFDFQLPVLRHLANQLASSEFKSQLINLGQQPEIEVVSDLKKIKPKWYATRGLS